MKFWLAHLSGRQRTSQISSKEAEKIGVRLLIAPVSRSLRPHNLRRLAHVRVLRTSSVF
jgi:hypothetical protein